MFIASLEMYPASYILLPPFKPGFAAWLRTGFLVKCDHPNNSEEIGEYSPPTYHPTIIYQLYM